MNFGNNAREVPHFLIISFKFNDIQISLWLPSLNLQVSLFQKKLVTSSPTLPLVYGTTFSTFKGYFLNVIAFFILISFIVHSFFATVTEDN